MNSTATNGGVNMKRDEKKLLIAVRTCFNISVAGADLLPFGWGEGIEAVAWGLKGIAEKIYHADLKAAQEKGLPLESVEMPFFNPVPDVHWAALMLPEVGDVITGGPFPSYAIPAAMQIHKDLKKLNIL